MKDNGGGTVDEEVGQHILMQTQTERLPKSLTAKGSGGSEFASNDCGRDVKC